MSNAPSQTSWIELPEQDESDHREAPSGTSSDIDSSGYDPSDDPASTPVARRHRMPMSGGPTSFPMQRASVPDWVVPFGNGKIPVDRMIKVAPISSGLLVPEAAGAWRGLQNAAQAAGWNLTMTGAYRSYDQQVSLFQQRYTDVPNGGSTKVWNGTTYWLNPKMAMAATPGTSNHGWGCAVDTALGGYGNDARPVAADAAFMEWVVKNAADFGWSWEVNSEPWHLHLVTPFPAGTSLAGAIGAPLPVLKLGSEGGQVAALQTICLNAGWGDCGKADGTFGPRTDAAVRVMQQDLGLEVDGIYGPASAKALAAAL